MNLEQWAAALHDSLATRAAPDRLLYLYVDRADLAEASGLADADLAFDDFCRAYQAQQSPEPFLRQARAAEQWRRAGWPGPCPFLPALAMTVLAVTEEPLGSPHGVYRRLNDLLGLEPDAKEPPGYSSHVPRMWQIWNEWLASEGSRYGRPSARSYPPYTYQSWARSQGIIRHRERMLIEDFLAGVRLPATARPPVQAVVGTGDSGASAPESAADGTDGSRINPAEIGRPREQPAWLETLADQLLEWLRYRGQDGKRLVELLDEDSRAIVIDVLGDEADRLATHSPRPRARAAGVLRATLMHDQWDRTFSGCLEVDERLWGLVIDVAGEEIELTGADLRVPFPAASAATTVLSRGESWVLRPGLSLRLAPTLAVVLHEDPLLGALVQVRGMTRARRYTVLVRDDLLPQVSEALADQAPLSTAPVGSEAPGWTWIRAVRPTSDSAQLRALGLGSLAVAASSPLALDGGLRLDGHRYLSGGEPDLIAPAAATITLDGREIYRPQPSPQAFDQQLEPSEQIAADVASDHDALESVAASDGAALSVSAQRTTGGGAAAVAKPVTAPGQAVTIRLADLYPAPGDHELTDDDGRTVTFSTAGHLRETPESAGRWSRVLDALAPQPAHGAETTAGKPVLRASGALATTLLPQGESGRVSLPPPRHASGASSLRMLRSRVWPNRRALVLREDASLVEVFPDTEPWLGEIGLHAATVDVLRTVRSMTPRPVLFIEYAARAARCVAVQIPPDAVLMPGQVAWKPADDLVSALASATWQAEPSADAARRRLLGLAITQPSPAPTTEVTGRLHGHAGRAGNQTGRRPAPRPAPQPRQQPDQRPGAGSPAPVTSTPAPAVFDPRDDVLSDPRAQNPYDDILGWLCERRTASASMAAFAEAWSWACERYGMSSIADRSRLAISRLSDLGFIEPDWARHRINAAPATLIELPASNGLLLLTGARPPRLLERIVDDEDPNDAVADATGLWTIHRKLQTIDDLPAAPTAIYLELDTAHTPSALEGLAALGVHTTTDPARRILSSLPAAADLSITAVQLNASPSQDIERRRPSLSGATNWSTVTHDNAPGLYRYRLVRGDQYAWRATPDAPLLAVTRTSGAWLDDARQQATSEQLRRLVHHTGSRALDVSLELGLPWPIRRALTLRTGLLPTPAQPPAGTAFERGTHLTYRNVDLDAAEQVSRILGRPLTH